MVIIHISHGKKIRKLLGEFPALLKRNRRIQNYRETRKKDGICVNPHCSNYYGDEKECSHNKPREVPVTITKEPA